MKKFIKSSISILSIGVVVFVAGALTHSSVSAQACDTTDCFIQKLELNQVNTDEIFIKRGPQTYINLAYAFWVVIIVVLVIARIALAGLGIAQSKEDAEKRKENFRKVVNALLGMIVGIGAPGIAFLGLSIIGIDPPEQEYLDCTQLTGDLQTECLRIKN